MGDQTADAAPDLGDAKWSVGNAEAAVDWYRSALGATELWDLGGVAGLQIAGAPFLVHEAVPGRAVERDPTDAGLTTTRIELFADDPSITSPEP